MALDAIFLEYTRDLVGEMLLARKQALVALTERLIEVESVDSAELKLLIDENSPGPLLVPGTDVARKSAPETNSSTDEQDRAAQ